MTEIACNSTPTPDYGRAARYVAYGTVLTVAAVSLMASCGKSGNSSSGGGGWLPNPPGGRRSPNTQPRQPRMRLEIPGIGSISLGALSLASEVDTTGSQVVDIPDFALGESTSLGVIESGALPNLGFSEILQIQKEPAGMPAGSLVSVGQS